MFREDYKRYKVCSIKAFFAYLSINYSLASRTVMYPLLFTFLFLVLCAVRAEATCLPTSSARSTRDLIVSAPEVGGSLAPRLHLLLGSLTPPKKHTAHISCNATGLFLQAFRDINAKEIGYFNHFERVIDVPSASFSVA